MADQGGLSVEDIMSTRLITVTPEEDLATALQRMGDHGIHRMPVIREDRGDAVLVGMLSDRDLRLAADSPYLGRDVQDIVADMHEVTVGEAMTEDVYTIGPSAPIAAAAELMLEHHVGGLPVVEWEGEKRFLVGVVTRSDMLARLIVLETDGTTES